MTQRTYLYMRRRIENDYIKSTYVCMLLVGIGAVYGLFTWHTFILTVSATALFVMSISVAKSKQTIREIDVELSTLEDKT